MRNLLKAAAVGAVVAPLVLAGASVAAASDGPSYAKHTAVAGPHGAASSFVLSGFHGKHGKHDHGKKRSAEGKHGHGHGHGHGPSYKNVTKYAGPKGAWVNKTASGVKGKGKHGKAYYYNDFKFAGPKGAGSSTTASHS
ncbi:MULTISPECIES: hypothetical protein [Streptomyces]|uniref:Uncharacterized protein n=2 Tax=Streptomyces diastaticus group TaxID=2849069 RepID=A0A8H9HC29_9ACTN|nr:MULTISPECIES: hypothetical protein [Streptomyces]NEE33406.1 hypothetical protein [Streptomyces sp. SID7982]NEE43622.1 hypothetical protein [Streptomyces sp. SID8455]MBL3803558.1 hypothetical protein [Streptomyces sp. BRB081]PJM83864.1 hypothetical protein CH313_07735 [Streptomyces sp. TSRI0384-2]QNE83961.1 hypothetical protein F0345_24980 [Streptomyces rutgersensis]